MSQTIIHTAMRKRLNALSPAVPIAWSGKEYTPTPGTAYLEPFLLPVETMTPTIGTDGLQEYQGIYQITAVYPAGLGIELIEAKASALETWFKRGVVLSEGALAVHVRKSWRAPMSTRDGWARIPISVLYYAHAVP